ncbi:MAG TPA: phosphatase PAP2 family protein [Microlunatus sp.]
MRLKDDTAKEERIGRLDLARWSTRLGGWLAGLADAFAVRFSARAVLWITAGIGAALVIALTAGGAEVYEAVEEGDGIAGLDRPVLDAAIGWRTAAANIVVTAFTQLGGMIGMTIIALTITTIMVVRWRSRTPLVLMVIAAAGSLAMTSVGKLVVGRVRPPTSDAIPPFEYSPSFPSGHTLNSTVIAGLVAYLLLRRLGSQWARVLTVVVAAAWAIAMGLSRVYLGHHWLTDVMMGWLLGLAWLCVVITAHRLFLTARRERQRRTAAEVRP